MTARQQSTTIGHRLGIDDLDAIYDRYVQPLENEHWGEFAVVSPGGEVIVGPSERDVFCEAKERFGHGNYLFKIGPRAVGRL